MVYGIPQPYRVIRLTGMYNIVNGVTVRVGNRDWNLLDVRYRYSW
jgi:hypothetical protein